jgi:hypothetical protein
MLDARRLPRAKRHGSSPTLRHRPADRGQRTHRSSAVATQAATASAATFSWSRLPRQPVDPLAPPPLAPCVPLTVCDVAQVGGQRRLIESLLAAGWLDPGLPLDETAPEASINQHLAAALQRRTPAVELDGVLQVSIENGVIGVDLHFWSSRRFVIGEWLDRLERTKPQIARAIYDRLWMLEHGRFLTPLLGAMYACDCLIADANDIKAVQKTLRQQQRPHRREDALNQIECDRYTERRVKRIMGTHLFVPRIPETIDLERLEPGANDDQLQLVWRLLHQLRRLDEALKCVNRVEYECDERPLVELMPARADGERRQLMEHVIADLHDGLHNSGENTFLSAAYDLEDFALLLRDLKLIGLWWSAVTALFSALGGSRD